MLAWLLERARDEALHGRDRSSLDDLVRARAQVELDLAELRLAEVRG